MSRSHDDLNSIINEGSVNMFMEEDVCVCVCVHDALTLLLFFP